MGSSMLVKNTHGVCSHSCGGERGGCTRGSRGALMLGTFPEECGVHAATAVEAHMAVEQGTGCARPRSWGGTEGV